MVMQMATAKQRLKQAQTEAREEHEAEASNATTLAAEIVASALKAVLFKDTEGHYMPTLKPDGKAVTFGAGPIPADLSAAICAKLGLPPKTRLSFSAMIGVKAVVAGAKDPEQAAAFLRRCKHNWNVKQAARADDSDEASPSNDYSRYM